MTYILWINKDNVLVLNNGKFLYDNMMDMQEHELLSVIFSNMRNNEIKIKTTFFKI